MHILCERTTRLLVFNAVVFDAECGCKGQKEVCTETNKLFVVKSKVDLCRATAAQMKTVTLQKERMIFKNSKNGKMQTKTLFVATDNYQ